jgi:hypothetical protein
MLARRATIGRLRGQDLLNDANKLSKLKGLLDEIINSKPGESSIDSSMVATGPQPGMDCQTN